MYRFRNYTCPDKPKRKTKVTGSIRQLREITLWMVPDTLVISLSVMLHAEEFELMAVMRRRNYCETELLNYYGKSNWSGIGIFGTVCTCSSINRSFHSRVFLMRICNSVRSSDCLRGRAEDRSERNSVLIHRYSHNSCTLDFQKFLIYAYRITARFHIGTDCLIITSPLSGLLCHFLFYFLFRLLFHLSFPIE